MPSSSRRSVSRSRASVSKRRKRATMTDRKCSLEKKKRATRKPGDIRTPSKEIDRLRRKAPLTVQTTFVRDHSTPTSHRTSAAEALMQEVVDLGVKGIRQEFVSDVRDFVPAGSTTQGDIAENVEKNRYDNIPLLDKTRVKLRFATSADYIHASLVHVDKGIDFICTQGPLENTVEAFWMMVLQEQCKLILQLCQPKEEGKEKSVEYFSSTIDETKTFGAVKVRTLEKLGKLPNMRKVSRTRLAVAYENTSAEILHLMYAGWPDHFVPENVEVACALWMLVNKLQSTSNPIVVHCSAGIGRTGTYVAVQMVMQKLKHKEVPDVKEIVKALREQRLGSVQNDRQYLFIYRMVVELLVMEEKLTKDQRVIDFFNEYEELIQRKRAEAQRKAKSR